MPEHPAQITFRVAEPAVEAALVHGWMQEPHVVPWWGLDGPPQRTLEHLVRQDALAHRDPWIVSDDGRPFAYCETFRIPEDPLGERYEAQPGDRGFRLLVGPPELLGTGAAQRLVRHMVTVLLGQYGITRVLCEVDARNVRMLALCRALGAEQVAETEPAGARSLLLGWTDATPLRSILS